MLDQLFQSGEPVSVKVDRQRVLLRASPRRAGLRSALLIHIFTLKDILFGALADMGIFVQGHSKLKLIRKPPKPRSTCTARKFRTMADDAQFIVWT